MKLEVDTILTEITDFYIRSHDFNGILVERLGKELNLSWTDLQALLSELITKQKITLTFGGLVGNPHIKRFRDLPVGEQVKNLQSEAPNTMCAYPTSSVIQSVVDVNTYNDKSFTKRLLLGEPQLEPVYFDLTVLEKYYADPRYLSFSRLLWEDEHFRATL